MTTNTTCFTLQRCFNLRCSHTIEYALRMQILESVCKFQKNFLYAQLLTPPLDYRPFYKRMSSVFIAYE